MTAAIKTLIAGIILLVGAASFASAGFIGVHYFSATTTQTQTTFATVQTTVVDTSFTTETVGHGCLDCSYNYTRTQTVTNTQTVTSTQTTTISQTITSTQTACTQSDGRPCLYPLNITVNVSCPENPSSCEYQGKIQEISFPPTYVGMSINTSFPIAASYEGGCMAGAACTVLFEWSFSLVHPTGTFLNSMEVTATINGVQEIQYGTTITGEMCEAYCT